MKRAFPRSFSVFFFLVAAQIGFAATELEFTPEATRLTAADVTIADKARLLRLTNGTLVVVWIQGAGPPDGAWNLDGSPYPPHDVFIRISGDDGTTWSDPLNVSNTAALTDVNALYDRVGDGSGLANYYGDSGKANVVASGNNILIAWRDAYHGVRATRVRAATLNAPTTACMRLG
jgi:hypothetical protein